MSDETPDVLKRSYVDLLERFQTVSRQVNDLNVRNQDLERRSQASLTSLEQRLNDAKESAARQEGAQRALVARVHEIEQRVLLTTPARTADTVDRLGTNFSMMSLGTPTHQEAPKPPGVRFSQALPQTAGSMPFNHPAPEPMSRDTSPTPNPRMPLPPSMNPLPFNTQRVPTMGTSAGMPPYPHGPVPPQPAASFPQPAAQWPHQGAHTTSVPPPMPHPSRQGALPFPDMDARPLQPMSEPQANVAIGPQYPGLRPLTTLLEPFQFVVDYRTYRLSNQREEPYPHELERVDKLMML